MAQVQGEDDDEDLQSPRLTPEMRSRKLQAHDFIKRYFARWGWSPTLGELAGHLGVSGKRAYDLVHQLSDELQLEITAGKTRGIRLIDRREELSEADVLLRMSSLGWTVVSGKYLVPPTEHAADAAIGAAIVQGLMEKGLPPLDYIEDEASDAAPPHASPRAPPAETGSGNGEIGESRLGARSSNRARKIHRAPADGDPDGLGAPPS